MIPFFSFLGKAARAVFNFLLPVVRTHAGNLLAVALPIAEEIVKDLATNSTLSGADKQAKARAQLQTALVAEGYATAAEIATSVLNLAIEMAVARLKAN